MTRLWTIPVLAAALTAGACSKPTTEAPPPAGDPAAPPAQAAPADPAPAPPSAAPAAAPRPVAPSRPATKAGNDPKPLQNSASTPSVREPAAPPKPTAHAVTVASGTELPLELLTSLSSETAAVEDEVRARLKQAVAVKGETVIPNGATLIGSVTQVERSGRVQGRAHLTVRFTEVTFSGERHRLNTEVLSFEAEATKKEDATKVGAGAGIGAVIGGILGGGKGAAKGAAIGGAAGGGAVLATRGKEVELASGTALTAVLAAPLTVTIEN
ncbi:MAG TPA: hypothetical protein VGQ37_18615 [Vicinamibacterales bacterium]|nr:hypothetical protein [Vicinamibacterales bacterium]